MKKLLLFIFLAFGINFGCFAANNATDVYVLAQANSVDDLKSVENIDVADSDGNTALCSAIKFGDVEAYNVLKKAGANTEHKCTKKIPSEQYKSFLQKVGAANKSWSFLGMGKWAWAAIGAGVAGGAIAAGMGGGGGGSGGSSGNEAGNGATGNNPGTGNQPEELCIGYNYISAEQCPSGYEVSDSCLSSNTTKYKCETPATCPYDTTECAGGWDETGNTCQSGEVLYKECSPKMCPYTTTSCTTGFYATGNTCLSGDETYIECAFDSENYIEQGGVVYPRLSCVHGNQVGNACSCESGWDGALCNVPATCSYNTQSCGAGYTETGNTCQSGTDVYVECEPVTCPYSTTSCMSGYHETGNSCQSGENIYVECEAVQCGAHASWQETGCACESGYQNYISGVGCELITIDCGMNAYQNGTQCQCNDGYQNWESGVGCSLAPIECGANATQQGTQCVCNSGYMNWTAGYGCYQTLDCGANATQVANSCICNPEYIHWIAGVGCIIYEDNPSNVFIHNTESSNVMGKQNIGNDVSMINILQEGDGVVYGILQGNENNGVIQIENHGIGTIYGFCRETEHFTEGSANFAGDASIGEIFIENFNDNATIYGLYNVNNNMYGAVNPTASNSTDTANITIINHGDSDSYGMYTSFAHTANAYQAGTGIINMHNIGTGNAYAMYQANGGTMFNADLHGDHANWIPTGIINITNYSSGNAFAMYGSNIRNENKHMDSVAYSTINMQNLNSGSTIGMYTDNGAAGNSGIIQASNSGNGNLIGMFGGTGSSITNDRGICGLWVCNTISLENDASGMAVGIYTNGGTAYNYAAIQTINNGTGTVIGMLGIGESNIINSKSNGNTSSYGLINMDNINTGIAIGIFGENDTNITNWSAGGNSEININNITGGTAIGIYTNGGVLVNNSKINIDNIDTGIVVGIFGDNNSNITNTSAINITRNNALVGGTTYIPTSDDNSTVFGIYARSGSTVNNSGTINITTNGNAYGIYAESGSTVTNTGTISINGVSCDNSTCDGSSTYNNHIVLNGSTLYNSGLMMAPQMNLNSMGGNVVAGLGSQFVIDNELSGDLNISGELVQNGNQTTYIAKNMIDAGDVSGLNVRSASAMFDASLADNGHDIVMQMKNFDSLTDNKSLAAFLATNYVNGKGQDLFNALKSMDTSAAFTNALGGLTGLNTFTQFAHEDLSAMREISFSMNNKLFENSGRDSFDISDSTGYFSFSNSHNGGSGQYGISSEKIAENWKLGYGMAMANINTGDGDNMHRQNKMWLFYMPATYTNDGYELVVAPKAGFANSEYSRRGYNNINYEGYIEKRIFGLMNDLRYPFTFGNWTLAPDLAFNAIVYDQSGNEDGQEFSLVIPDDRTVSVETGFGLYTKYEKTFESGARLKLNSGLMAYREFGDMYNIKLGIRGMDGTFNLYNNDYTYRGAASFGFDYTAGKFHLYGNAQYFMDNDNYMNFKGGVSYRF